nr:hypothetical protein [Tanacetum cinerariifolium]
MANVALEFIIRIILQKGMIDPNSKLTETRIDLNELCKKMFKDLQCNTFSRMEKVIDMSENDIASSDEEWEESDNENLPNTIDSLLEPKVDTRNKNMKLCENGFNTQKAPSSSNMEDTQPDEKWCKVENFEVIKYSVGDSEEFLAVRTRECNSLAQTVNGVSNIYRDIFSKKDNGWTIHQTR